MKVEKGDRYRDKITGQLYRVTKTNRGTVVLEAEGVSNRSWSGDKLLNLFFKKVKTQKEGSD